ncbi:MAG TPA: DUF6596 domain-containing protein [Gemmatimonadales bacterium]|nr:DUF6596 domain-containing protein [Gemmatimonadales bacterium]
MTGSAERAVEHAARSSYGRLVAILAARTGDVMAAEDALGDAFAAALAQWPEAGVPQKPEAWLVSVARRRLVDRARREQVQDAAADGLRYAADLLERTPTAPDALPDPRLAMLAACAHPAIDPGIRTPIMLQVVLGLDAAAIASAFLVPPATMAQRLVRAKAKIREARIPIEVPAPEALAERLPPMLEAIYAAYGTAWDDVLGADPARRDLGAEAIWLGRVLVEVLPHEPEAKGLLALMLYCESRRAARRDEVGAYVSLAEQDVGRWSHEMIDEAESLLLDAARAARPGRFQCEAAINSAHAARRTGAGPDWRAIAMLYDELVRHVASVGAFVSRAAAHAEAFGAARGLALLEELPDEATRNYQPAWALRGHLLLQLGRREEARGALERAAGMVEDPAVRAFLLGKLAASLGD